MKHVKLNKWINRKRVRDHSVLSIRTMQVMKLSKLIQLHPNMSSDQFWDSLVADLSLQRGKAFHCSLLFLVSLIWCLEFHPDTRGLHAAAWLWKPCDDVPDALSEMFDGGRYVLQLSLASRHGWAAAALHNKSTVTRWGDRSSRKEFPQTELLGGKVLSSAGLSLHLWRFKGHVFLFFQLWSAETEPMFQVKPFQKHELFNIMGRRYYSKIILQRYPPEPAC